MIIPDNCIHCHSSLLVIQGRTKRCINCVSSDVLKLGTFEVTFQNESYFWATIYFEEVKCSLDFYQETNSIEANFRDGSNPISINFTDWSSLDLSNRAELLHRLKTILTFS